jgi:hypothetical protein
MQDIAMIDGDLVVTDLGDLAITASDNDDVIQMANNNIMTRLGENIHHPEVGNDVYNKRLKITSSGLAEVESDSKNAILNDTRVSDVYNILAYAGDNYGECIIEYALTTVDGSKLDGRVSVNIF